MSLYFNIVFSNVFTLVIAFSTVLLVIFTLIESIQTLSVKDVVVIASQKYYEVS